MLRFILRKKAEKGDVEAMKELGFDLVCQTCEMDLIDEGIEWLQKAVDTGDLEAAAILGKALSLPHIDRVDLKRSKELIESSAHNGNAYGQCVMGDMMLHGDQPFDCDPISGKHWLEQSAAQNYEPAVNLIAWKWS